MDASFLEVARAATVGSSRVRSVATAPDTTRVRSAEESLADRRTPEVRLQLWEDDGLLQWEEMTGPPIEFDGFRSTESAGAGQGAAGAGQGAAGAGQGAEAIEVRFDRLRPSQVTKFLAGRDRVLTPERGLRKLDIESKSFRAEPFPQRGDALVFVHGTFSNSENMVSGLLDPDNASGNSFIDEAMRRYDGNVFAFDHPTLSVGPILNAIDLQDAIGDSKANVHLIGHSRGGLVSRWWCEMFDRDGGRCDKTILVGSPLRGTGLAAPTNIRDAIDLLTHFSRTLQVAAGLTALAVPVFSVVEALLRVVTSVTSIASRTPVVDAAMAMVPGLFAMSRVGNNPELLRLLDKPPVCRERDYAIRADFQPEDPSWRFWRMFRKDRLIDAAADALFGGANDLVVDTPSMTGMSVDDEIPSGRVLDFGISPTVHHLNYFQQAETSGFLSDVLL